MIRLHTFSELVAQNHTLGLYCINCDRWHVADLDRLIDDGIDRFVTDARFKCHVCGELAEKQVRPPVPTLGSAVAYISGIAE